MTFDYYQRPYVYDILYKDGGNDTLRKCLAFDTEVEPMYLYGDFGVKATAFAPYDAKTNTYRAKAPYVLTGRGRCIDVTDIIKDGYLFFMGELTAETVWSYRSGDPTFLELGGRFAYARISVNGEEVKSSLFDTRFDLSPFLREGENLLRLTLCFSARNLMGPHNRSNPEPFEVMPRYLSYEKQWIDGKCSDYVSDKAFVRFGIGF